MSQIDIAPLLKKSPVFSVLDNNEISELASTALQRSAVEGETIFWEGDDSAWFYIIAEGKVKIFKSASTGKEVLLSFFGPGEMFGEVAVFENKPYPATAQSLVDTRLIGIRKADFMNFLIKYPLVSLKIIAILSGRLRESQSRLRDLAAERVEQRLARMLIMLSAKMGSTLPFTRQEISDMAGTTTETVIRVFSQWKERGIIDSTRGQIIIQDDLKLKLLADGPPMV